MRFTHAQNDPKQYSYTPTLFYVLTSQSDLLKNYTNADIIIDFSFYTCDVEKA